MLVLTLLENVISLDYSRAQRTTAAVAVVVVVVAVYCRWLLGLGVGQLLVVGCWRSLVWFAVGSHGETFYDDYCNSLPQTIITFHYENGGHIITWISHTHRQAHTYSDCKTTTNTGVKRMCRHLQSASTSTSTSASPTIAIRHGKWNVSLRLRLKSRCGVV